MEENWCVFVLYFKEHRYLNIVIGINIISAPIQKTSDKEAITARRWVNKIFVIYGMEFITHENIVAIDISLESF